MKYGIELLLEQPGDGPAVERHESYRIRVKMWLNRGDPVRWEYPWGLLTHADLEDDGATLVTVVRMDRGFLIPGLFYGMEGMRIGGIRKLRIPPSLAFGETGIADRIPPNAVITAEISVLAKKSETSAGDAGDDNSVSKT
jgi:FKBP-type peptidyl-prolyl cis-trans isomerase